MAAYIYLHILYTQGCKCHGLARTGPNNQVAGAVLWFSQKRTEFLDADRPLNAALFEKICATAFMYLNEVIGTECAPGMSRCALELLPLKFGGTFGSCPRDMPDC